MPSQPIPSVFRQPRSTISSSSSSQRPRTLEELSDLATSGSNRASLTVDSSIPITRYLIGSETLTKQAETSLKQGNIDEAFIALVKNCKLLIEVLPNQHRGYQSLDGETKKRLKSKGQWNLDQLSQIKVKVVDRYEAWIRANPDAPPAENEKEKERKRQEAAKREMLRPVPSTGMMEPSRTRSSSTTSSHSSDASIAYVKPNRIGDFGFDVRDILGYSKAKPNQSRAVETRSIPPSSPNYSSPFTSSPLQPFQHSHSTHRSAGNLGMAVNYPSLRPASSIRMNNHQVSQGFAPRSEQTYRYYQIQSPSSTYSQGPAFPIAHPHVPSPTPPPRPRPLPSPSPSQANLTFSYPTVSSTSNSVGRSNTTQATTTSSASVENQAKRLLQPDNDVGLSSTATIRGTTTEGGEHLRTLIIPGSLISTFVSIAEANTKAKIETCGLLMGTIDVDMLQVNHLLIPKQSGSSDRCDTEDEEGIWNFMDSKGLVTLGWCHTHPQQSCFMSSLDLHTHSAYQATLPEAIAIVCAPNDEPSFGLFRLTSPFGLQTILTCKQPGLFHPHVTDSGKTIEAIYTDAINGHVILADAPLAVTDLRRR